MHLAVIIIVLGMITGFLLIMSPLTPGDIRSAIRRRKSRRERV
jgi:hypothetical protein